MINTTDVFKGMILLFKSQTSYLYWMTILLLPIRGRPSGYNESTNLINESTPNLYELTNIHESTNVFNELTNF